MPTAKDKNTTKPAAKRGKTASNSVKLDAENPVPFEGSNFYSFSNDSYYLPFLSEDDQFALKLLKARMLSATQSACIETKRDFCAGSEMIDVNGTALAEDVLAWFKSMNNRNEPITELNRQAFENFFIWGNCPIELVRLTVAGKKYFYVYVHNFMEWRLGPENEEGICTEAIQSKQFLQTRVIGLNDLEKATRLPIYNPLRPLTSWKKDGNGVERTLIWYKNTMAGYPHYGMPSSVGSLIYQVLEYKGARYDLDNFENGMVVSTVVVIKGATSPDEARKVGRDIIETHTGEGKAGRVIVLSSEQGLDEGVEIHNLETKKEGSFVEADNKWSQKIISAHQWDAILAGLVSPSTLGKGEGFLTKLFEIKQKTVIQPAQKHLIENVWLNVFRVAQDFLGLKLDAYTFGIKTNANISSLSDVDITTAVSVDEVREANSMPAHKDPAIGASQMPYKAPGQTPKQESNVPAQ